MKKMFFLLLLVSIAFNFTGCIPKNIDTPKEEVINEEKSGDAVNCEPDGFADEFADEFAVKEIYDPFRGYNRFMTSFNDSAYEYLLKPVSRGYRAVLHKEIRESVRKFFHNLYYPMRLVNNILQGKFENASEETGRFVINTTVGVLGLFDPARSQFELEAHEEDFGQTLGFYGVGSGPHIVLPFLGPSNLRDALSIYPDSLLSPIDYADRSYWTLTDTWEEYLAARTLENVNRVSLHKNGYDKIKKDAVDLYPYLRDIYEQHRDKQIKE